jgi:predicted MFS family arabinose efflux permease
MHAGGVREASEWRQHWTVLVPCLAGIMLCAVHGYSLGVMIGPLEREFGWSRAEISTGPLIVAMTALIGAPLIGRGVDRFGPRRIGLIGILFFCTMLGSLSLATSNILSWLGLWALLAVSAMFVIPTVWTAAVTSLFVANRGFALALTLCGTSLCAMLTPLLTNGLVQAYGWRGAYVGLALIYAVLVFPPAWLLFRTPLDVRRAPAVDGRAVEAPLLSGFTVRAGLASPAFLKLAAAVIVYSLALCALTTNAVPVLMGQGLTAQAAAGVAGLIGIGSLVGRLGGGLLLDRIAANRIAAASVLIPVISVLLLLAFPGSMRAAIAASLIFGLSAGTEVDACAYLAARHFGLRSFGTLFGAINGLLLFANGLAPMIANAIYDATRSYDIFLWAVIPACIAASLLFLAMGAYPDHEVEAVAG